MCLVSAKGYENAGACFLIEKDTGITWTSMKNVQDGLGVQNIFDLVLKDIYSIYKKNLTKDQTKNYIMTEKDIFEKYANLSKTKLNAKNNKEVYPKNDVMTINIKRCRGEKEHEVK